MNTSKNASRPNWKNSNTPEPSAPNAANMPPVDEALPGEMQAWLERVMCGVADMADDEESRREVAAGLS